MRFLIQQIQQWFGGSAGGSISEAGAQARVRRGAAYLDDADPGWHQRIDPSVLELSAGESCILGQLHGTFRMGLGRSHLINLSSAPRASLSPVEYGFQCISGLSEEDEARDYVLLNRAWHDALRQRLQPEAAAPDAPSADRLPRRGADNAVREAQPPARQSAPLP